MSIKSHVLSDLKLNIIDHALTVKTAAKKNNKKQNKTIQKQTNKQTNPNKSKTTIDWTT